MAFNDPYMEALMEHYSKEFDVPLDLVHSVATNESRGKQTAISPKGAIGVMQLMPETAKGLNVNPHDLEDNIKGGVKYLSQQLDKFGSPDLAVAAYNAGPGVVSKAGHEIPQNMETPGFVNSVIGLLAPKTAEAASGVESIEDIIKQAEVEAQVKTPKISTEDILKEAEAAQITPAQFSGHESITIPPGPIPEKTTQQKTDEEYYGELTPIAGEVRKIGEGLAPLGRIAQPALNILGLPHEYITKPFIQKPLDYLLTKLGVPESVEVPTRSMLAGEMAGTLPTVEGEPTVEAPLKSLAVTGTGALGDIVVYGAPVAGYRMGMKAFEKGVRKLPKGWAEHWESGELGDVVLQGTYKTKIPSTLGPAGTVIDKIPLHEGHVVMRNQLAAGELPGPLILPIKASLKTNQRVLEELNDIAPGMADEFYWKPKKAENVSFRQAKLVEDQTNAWRTELGDIGARNIAIRAVADRRFGKQALKGSGVTDIPSLTLQEAKISNEIKIRFYGTLEQLNEARALSGMQPIKTDLDYFTFMRIFNDTLESGIDPIMAANSRFTTQGTPFKYAKELKGGLTPIHLDAFDVYKNYMIQAQKHINLSPHIAKIRDFVSKEIKLPDGTISLPLTKTNPQVAQFLMEYAASMAGVNPNVFGRFERILGGLSNNLVVDTLGLRPRSMLAQLGSIAAAYAETGLTHMIKGFTSLLNPKTWTRAGAESLVHAQRRMDVVLEDLGRNMLGNLYGRAQHLGMKGLEGVDFVIAVGVREAALSKAKSLGLEGTEALKFADRKTIETQGSASSIDRSLFQRSPLGKAATSFQTITIAEANWFARNVLGRGKIDFTTREGFIKAGKLVAAGYGLNVLFRHVIGMPPVTPEPIERFQQAREEGAGVTEATWEGIKEFMPYVPVLGSMAYGRAPGGALASNLADLASGKRTPAEVLTALTGIPGGDVARRLLKTEEGGNLRDKLEALTTLPVGQRGGGKTQPMTTKEALLGRDPLEKRRRPWRIDEWLNERMR